MKKNKQSHKNKNVSTNILIDKRMNIIFILCQALAFCIVFQILFGSLQYLSEFNIPIHVSWHIVLIVLNMDMVHKKCINQASIIGIFNCLAFVQMIIICIKIILAITYCSTNQQCINDLSGTIVLLGLCVCSCCFLLLSTILIVLLRNNLLKQKKAFSKILQYNKKNLNNINIKNILTSGMNKQNSAEPNENYVRENASSENINSDGGDDDNNNNKDIDSIVNKKY